MADKIGFADGTDLAEREYPVALGINPQKVESSAAMKPIPPSQRGFTLVELMIVVAIIGIVAAIAVPYLEQARQASKSASAINSLRTINSAQNSYRSAMGQYGSLADLGNANYIADANLSGGEKSGYTFTISSASDLNYEAAADPILDPINAFQHYYIDGSGLIRVEVGAPATTASAALGE